MRNFKTEFQTSDLVLVAVTLSAVFASAGCVEGASDAMSM